MTTPAVGLVPRCLLLSSNQWVLERGGHRYFRQHGPFVSLSGPAVPGRRMPCGSHDPKEGQPQLRAANPDT